MASTIRYRAVCVTCGPLEGTWRFQEDATAIGEKHQEEHTFRILRCEPANKAHETHAEITQRVALALADLDDIVNR